MLRPPSILRMGMLSRLVGVQRTNRLRSRRILAVFAGLDEFRLEDLLQEHRAESGALPSVLYDETDVGRGRFLGRPVARHADQAELLPRIDLRNDRHPLAIVAVGKGVRFLRAQSTGEKESPVHRAQAQPMAQRDQTRRSIGTDRTEANRGTIAQYDYLLDVAGESVDSDAPGVFLMV